MAAEESSILTDLDYPRSIFVSVLDMSSVSSVLQMIVLKYSIPKWNMKKYMHKAQAFQYAQHL